MSWNAFRYAGDLLHLAGIAWILYDIGRRKAAVAKKRTTGVTLASRDKGAKHLSLRHAQPASGRGPRQV